MSKTAERALDLLEHLVQTERPVALMELSASCGLDKSTTARLLKFLLERSMLSRDPITKRYDIGPGLTALAAAVVGRSRLHEVCAPHLTRLRDKTGETATLHIRVGYERICVAGAESHQPIRRVAPLGERIPLWLGTSGKVMLAFMSPAEIDRVLEESGEVLTIQRLKAELVKIRTMCYLVNTVGDRAADVGAVSAPLFDSQGVVAALTVAGPNSRWSAEKIQAAVPLVTASAAEISRALGKPTETATRERNRLGNLNTDWDLTQGVGLR